MIRFLSSLLVVLLGAAACSTLEVSDFNASSLNSLQTNPTAATVAAATTGILVSTRLQNQTVQRGYVEGVGVMGRESHSLDPSNPGTNTSRVVALTTGPLSTVWPNAYRSIRQQQIVLDALDKTADLSAQQKEAIRGFVKTMQTLDLLAVINLSELGAVIDIKPDPAGAMAPIATKAAVFARIVQLLDEGKAHLQNGGPTFPMPLSTGFTDFNTPAAFLKFNRGLKARVDVYMGNFSSALTALSESFLSLTAPLTLGAYHAFSTNPGDAQNPYFDPVPRVIFAHSSVLADAQLRANGTKDLRALAKAAPITPKVQLGVPVDARLTVYTSASAPIPIIRNEELILLRAEANIGLNTAASLSAAIQDINFIRANSGGLPPITDPYVPGPGQPPTLLDELLYEKRYSLLFEGHRWVDLRRYNKLAQLPKTLPTHKVFPYFPLTDDECVPRDPKPAGCTIPAGF